MGEQKTDWLLINTTRHPESFLRKRETSSVHRNVTRGQNEVRKAKKSPLYILTSHCMATTTTTRCLTGSQPRWAEEFFTQVSSRASLETELQHPSASLQQLRALTFGRQALTRSRQEQGLGTATIGAPSSEERGFVWHSTNPESSAPSLRLRCNSARF